MNPSNPTPNISTPLTLSNGVVLKNRLYKAAMDEQLAPNNTPGQVLVRLYDTWAKGGAAVLVTGHVMIDRRFSANFDTTAVDDERDLPILQAWVQAGTQNGTKLLMQLNHPGKQIPKNVNKQPVAPSAVPLSKELSALFNPPRALSEDEILDIIRRFGQSAKIAEKAGFSGVQIHAAHGYLLSQFLSPHHNRRTDNWGGSLENRMRILVEIYHEIRRQTSDGFIVALKLNSADFQKGGFGEDESVQVLAKMAALGVDLLEISGGNYESPAMMEGVKDSTKKREAYFLDYADKARAVIGDVPLVITGGFRSMAAMNEALSGGSTDMIGMAKPYAVMPDVADKLTSGSLTHIATPPVRTGIKAIDKRLGGLLEIYWYTKQLHLLGQGKPANPNYSAYKTLWGIVKDGVRRERG
ncbi:NADH:flavin oxidoreductase/NADH oxidase family protein [Bergeriella denitrificans]|uniref:FMN oxidoreductase CC3083 n=1 Tax=Bergeriella denitrificans TaxID=494 RepID=A0A378UGV7_BERDE|nr:NADH:flavin oxidoreductase/NADH oxidase family protein [Bergeriella denitrificans]STZ76537.1 FMN oxidoreductase CC3083 [Bergeriella denitrificans]